MNHSLLLNGLIRIHVLHHAIEHEIYGQWMLNELAEHGYKLSPGTLYPMLQRLEEAGYLTLREQRNGSARRKLYRATPLAEEAMEVVQQQLQELTREAISNDQSSSASE